MNKLESHIRNNLYEFYSRIAEVCGLLTEKESGWSVVQNKPGYWPNLFYGLGSGFANEQNTGSFSEKIGSGNFPNLLIGSDQHVEGNDAALRNFGFMPITRWTGMALEKHSELKVPEIPEGISISKPQTDDELEQWINIVNEQLLSTEMLDRDQLKLILDQPDFDARMLLFNGEVVSTILVFRSAEATGLYFIATKKPAQRKGFARLLIRMVCLEEFKSSEKPLVLHATKNGEAVYQKLGFESFNPFFLYWKINTKP
ncbi:MAG: GNAT family N-acetyltransferase [Prolixibacteraceae bacterium]